MDVGSCRFLLLLSLFTIPLRLPLPIWKILFPESIGAANFVAREPPASWLCNSPLSPLQFWSALFFILRWNLIFLPLRMTLYAACLEGSDPLRLFEKRLNARKGTFPISPSPPSYSISFSLSPFYPLQKLGMNLTALGCLNTITWASEGLP